MATVEEQVRVANETGLHARPASIFVEKANQSEVKLIKENQEANAKSIMGIMSLGIDQDTGVTIQAKGEDAEEAVKALVTLVKTNFGE